MSPLFNRLESTAQQAVDGATFSDATRIYLHNLRADYAEQLLELPFTPADVMGYAQNEAVLQAKVELLTALLEAASNAVPNAAQ